MNPSKTPAKSGTRSAFRRKSQAPYDALPPESDPDGAADARQEQAIAEKGIRVLQAWLEG
ncbi:MAG TPA: hypothetical protein PLY90_02805 [Candidatus Hydrogenedentes bacterium]|jgi:hypothetical protein|nr:hypothetical protein [Candidatus Hydrogenedentota bacterium]HPX87229.1 hypothetical protein [Candidatus Hydrogenedentota bacterium]HQB02203.1 hypothetical protein [Candidatus Hydrogenedentota bacterium]